jgi:hypothetical protein
MRLGRRGVVGLAVLAVGLAAVLFIVVMRAPIAEALAIRVLAWRGIEARLHVRALNFDRAVVEALAIGAEDSPAIAARRIEARYSVVGALNGQLRAVTVEGLEVRAAVDEQGARLEGLPALGGGGTGGGRPTRTPAVSIPDGRVYVATPAGELVADLALEGGPDTGWTGRVAAQPAALARGDDALELSAGSLDASIQGEELTVAAELRLAALRHPGMSARDAGLSFRFAGRYTDATKLAGLEGEGAASFAVAGAGFDAEAASAWAERLAPTTIGAAHEAVGPHLDELRAILVAALAELSATGEFAVTVAEERAVIAPVGDVALAAASGSRIALASAGDTGGGFTLDLRSGALGVRDLSLTADLSNTLDARVIINTASARRERGGPAADAVLTLTLAPWTAGELTLGVDVQRLGVTFAEGGWRGEAEAELRATGARFGVGAEDLVARLDLEVVRDAEGVAVRPRGDALQRLTATRLTMAGREFDDAVAGVGPYAEGGTLLRVREGGIDIETRLRDVSAGAEALGGRWAALLPAVEFVMRIDADGSQEASVYVQAPRFEGRLEGGDAILQASVVDAGLTIAPEPHARLRFEGLSLGGSALPASLAHAAGELDATLREGLPEDGRVTVTGAELTDSAELARLARVTINGEAPISGGVLAGAMSATAAAGGRSILRADLVHNFRSGEGSVALATPRFAFAPGGLQPSTISPFMTGKISNVGGGASLELAATWGGAEPTASGAFVLDRLAFDWRFGRVEGLTTRFSVADLIGVHTDAPQRIEVGLIDPGLPLRDGSLVLELLGPTRVRLATGRFPFAGGAIIVAPAEIDLAAENKLLLLVAESISLVELQNMFRPPNLNMTGAMSGRIPIEARGRSAYIVDGVLTSDAPGVVSYTGRAGEGIAQQSESTKLAFDALANFQYSRLTLRLDGDVAGELTASVRLEGRNPNVLDGYPIDFNINTTERFADLLTDAFRGLSLSAAARNARIADEEDEP